MILMLIIVGCKPRAAGAEWVITPGLSVTGTYLDNVTLAPPGEEEGDFVTELNPEISIQVQGRRTDFNLGYRMQNLFYAKNSEVNTTNHELTTDASAELLRDLFFVDFTASYNQVLITPEGRRGFNNLSITDDTTDVGTFSLSPYLIKRFGNTAFGELRYAYEKVDYSGSNESSADTDINRIFANLSSSPFARNLGGDPILSNQDGSVVSGASHAGGELNTTQGVTSPDQGQMGLEQAGNLSTDRGNRLPGKTPSNPFQWSATYQRDESDSTDQTNTLFEEVALDLSYLINPRLAFLTTLGYENNDFERSSEVDEPKGFFWSLGAAWNPLRRTTMEASVGERSFGSTYSFALRHYTRQTTVEIKYFEELTDSAGAALENRAALDDESDSVGSQGFVEVPLPAISNEVFLRKRLTADVSRATAKSIFSVQLYNEERDFQVSGDQEQVYGGIASWDWRPTVRTDARLLGQWEHLEESGGDDLNRWEIGLRLTRQIRRDIDGAIEYRHLQQDALEAEDDYEQNSIAASVQVQF
jgi:hypothetical protein